MKILIVDDTPTDLNLLRAQLEAEGHAVFEAHDGVDALAVLERQRVDAVISDILMPRMDGYRLCHEIRKHARLHDLPIIIYTATYTSPSDEKLALDVGADKYLKKPASVEILVAALHEVITQPRTAPRAEALGEVEVLKEYSERLVNKLEEKNAELQAAKDKFRALVEQSIVGIYIIQDDQFVYVNPGMARILGRSEEEMISGMAYDFVVPEDRALARENMRKRISGGLPSIHYSLRVLHQSGAVLQVEVHSNRVDYNGRPAVMGMLLDITERKQAEEALRESEARLRAIIDNEPECVKLVDKDGRLLEMNPAGLRMIEADSLLQVQNQNINSIIIEEHRAAFRALLGKTLRGESGTLEFDIIGLKGTRRTLDTHAVSLRDATGAVTSMLGITRDITERKASEAKIQRLINLYAALSQCNQAIVRCTSEDELFPQICRDVVQFGGMKMAWIGLVDQQSKRVNPVAAFGAGIEYLEGIQISVDADEPSGRGPIGIAMRENRSYWCQDYLNEPLLALWRERGVRSGWAASAALPLHRNGVIVGSLILYSGVMNAFDEAARNLMVAMATDISYALTRFALLAERRKTEDAMRIAAVTFDTQEGIMITDVDANILRVNQAFQEITGYSAAEVIGQNPRMFQSGRHDEYFYQAMWSALLNTGKWSGEVWDRRKDGSIYPKLMTITTVYDDNHQVTNHVAVFRDISNRKKLEQEIYQLAFYDSLTMLPNRGLLVDRLQQGLAVSARNGRYGALLFLDLDHFKTINDTQGHAMGDQLLIEVARRLQTCVREGDSVARLGGDEFVVVLEDMGSEADAAATKTELVAEKIRSELSQPYLLKNFECLSTASIGISLFSGHPESAEDLLMHADVAMYQAKTAGRNAIRFFDPQMQMALEARASLEADLRHALEKQQFRLYYQIQVDSLRRPLGVEVLLRWDHPQRGLVSPMQFIPLAEETGLIMPIGLWVLQTACAQLKEWQNDALTRDLTLAVNVSAKQFHRADFVVQVQRVLLESGVQPSQLKLELTESIVLENVEDTISKMREIKALGVSFSMDDFGTGYSSLQYLKRLPLDQIKIDQAFVRDITIDHSDAAIVKTIIAMTEALGLDVIAEGVETQAQREFLDLHGCHVFQGYLFGKPVPLDEFERLLKGSSPDSHSSDHLERRVITPS